MDYKGLVWYTLRDENSYFLKQVNGIEIIVFLTIDNLRFNGAGGDCYESDWKWGYKTDK